MFSLRSLHTPLCVIILFLLLSCTSGKPASINKPGSATSGNGAYALEIVPAAPTRKSTLRLSARGFDLSGATIAWLVNGIPVVGSGRDQMDASETARGDTVQAQVLLRNREIRSNSVQIGNTLPEMKSVKLVPEVFKPGDLLSVDVAGFDSDGDVVTYLYEWTRNNEPAGNTKSIELPLHRGDVIEVKITPFDGTDAGTPALLHREIGNMPPVIVENTEFGFDGKVYTYQVKASDPDSDTLTYSLGASPDGVAIDPSTGMLTWTVPPDFKGSKSVSVIVNDGHGGTCNYTVETSIN